MAGEAEAVVVARDATYARAGYRSFEFASFEARAGECLAVLSDEPAAVRDLLLAVAGVVRPTAGSLAVAGAELAAGPHAGAGSGALARARRLLSGGRRGRLPRGTVGTGFVTGLFEVDGALTVDEAVRRELALAGVDAGSDEALGYLGRLGLATVADRAVADLDPASRARFSAALALAGRPRAACADLADPFCAGMPVEAAARLAGDLARIAREEGAAVIVGCVDPRVAAAFGAVCALDGADGRVTGAADGLDEGRTGER